MAERILVAGGGTMGAGIAFVAARGGFEVEIIEPLDGARVRALEMLQREAQRAGDSASLDRITWSRSTPESTDAVLAIEAVPEIFNLKRDVLASLARAVPPDALLATNTSSLSVSSLAAGIAQPQRVLGLHFFNPPPRMQLIEIVATDETSDDAVEAALAFCARFGKTGVVVGDTPGFVVNRVARPYYLQSLRAVEHELGDAAELDALARGIGFRMGPFELMDLIGLDVNLATSESVYERTGEDRLEPVGLQRAMVAEGRLGRKTGEGFYRYKDGKAERFEPDVPPQAPGPNDDEIVAVLGFDERAHAIAQALRPAYSTVVHVENDDIMDELPPDATMLIDVGNGIDDRSDVLAQLDASFGPETVIFADAYVTDLRACARRLRHAERLVGYGVLGPVEDQRIVEVVSSEIVSDDALALAQDLFSAMGKGVTLVEDDPGLFLGRVVGSIVNEAMTVVAEDVATPADVDTAMQLGANYPHGPVAWGRAIGGARIRNILKRLADAEGEQFAPHRSLWVLDLPDEEPAGEESAAETPT
jgi:3-hydroxybutyryl-CoA dehydrogenase